jgi:hypothetical protein
VILFTTTHSHVGYTFFPDNMERSALAVEASRHPLAYIYDATPNDHSKGQIFDIPIGRRASRHGGCRGKPTTPSFSPWATTKRSCVRLLRAHGGGGAHSSCGSVLRACTGPPCGPHLPGSRCPRDAIPWGLTPGTRAVGARPRTGQQTSRGVYFCGRLGRDGVGNIPCTLCQAHAS